MFQSVSRKIAHLFSVALFLVIPLPALAGAPIEPVLYPNLHDKAELDRHLHLLNQIYPCDWHDAHTRSGYNLYDLGNGIQVLEFSCTVGLHNLANLYIRRIKGSKQPAQLIALRRPKGQPVTSQYILFNSFWDLNRGALTSFTVDRGLSDCGSFEVHRFTSDGYLELIEYRAKRNCDGKFREPTDYPLIYPAM
ncbi:DUF1176 domain-containing protein [Pseudovibrio denitrificans]|uniref:DUF1176 domain-containing protein n=1 Tax=Pseudovibrio denitrificans TaxID=258256 RepID=UPI0039BF2F2E